MRLPPPHGSTKAFAAGWNAYFDGREHTIGVYPLGKKGQAAVSRGFNSAAAEHKAFYRDSPFAVQAKFEYEEALRAQAIMEEMEAE